MRSHHILYEITCIVPLYHSLYIWHYIHSICVIKTSASIIPHQLYVWHRSQYAWHHMNTLWCHTSIVMTSHTVYLWHHNNIYDINANAFMKTQLYLTSHPRYLTSSHCTCAATPAVSIDQNNFGRYPTWHRYDIIHTLHDITIILYDIFPQYFCHHSHCIYDIRSPIYDITSRVYDISSPIPVTA